MENINVPILGIIENMSWFTPKDHKNEKYFIFGQHGGKDLATSLNLDLLGEIPLVQVLEGTDVDVLLYFNRKHIWNRSTVMPARI